ncbi:MAG: hypothetical protein NTNFB01_26940 [Nitrospira sp.]
MSLKQATKAEFSLDLDKTAYLAPENTTMRESSPLKNGSVPGKHNAGASVSSDEQMQSARVWSFRSRAERCCREQCIG